MPKALLLFFALRAWAQTVTGSVFDAATNTGVAGVKVELLKGATAFYETTSDGGGRFLFDNVREGDYAVRYQSPNYFSTAGPSDYRQFHVSDAAPTKLEVRLLPYSRISGRVVDGRGVPIPDARVQVSGRGMTINGHTYLRTSWGGGGGPLLRAVPLEMSFDGVTDSKGNFEVLLMPGDYRLSVTPPPAAKPPVADANGPALAWRRTWYPGVTLPEAAGRITALPGAATDVEIRLLALPVHTVRGIVLLPNGAPAARTTITLGAPFPTATTQSDAEGLFEIPAVAEGDWSLSADTRQGSPRLSASESIKVGNFDLENVKLRLATPITVRVKVVKEPPANDAPQSAAAARLGPIILQARSNRISTETDLAPRGSILLSNDGRLDYAADAYPGVYGVGEIMQPPPPPYYLDSIRSGGGDALTGDVTIAADSTVTVTYKSDGGIVRGKVEDCASGGVLLVPAAVALRRSGLSAAAPCDASGQYEIRAVRPGDYYALAFAGNGPVLPVDDELLKRAVKVTVRAGEATAADAPVVTKPVF